MHPISRFTNVTLVTLLKPQVRAIFTALTLAKIFIWGVQVCTPADLSTLGPFV